MRDVVKCPLSIVLGATGYGAVRDLFEVVGTPIRERLYDVASHFSSINSTILYMLANSTVL